IAYGVRRQRQRRADLRVRETADDVTGDVGFARGEPERQRHLLRRLARVERGFDASETPKQVALSLGLTAREADVAGYVVRGFTNAEIGTALSLSAHTVRNHLAAAFKKAGVTTRAELVGVLLRGG